MFGYVRPLRGELKVWELERYKAVYCGLCRAIKADYGMAMTFTLNYDFAFLALLLSGSLEQEEICACRCAAGCFRKRPAAKKSSAMESAAAASVLLFKWKLKDQLADSGPAGRLAARAALGALGRGFKKAGERLEWFDRAVGENIARLALLEKEPSPGLDAPADTFAEILASLSELFPQGAPRRCARELLYHTGRWIYIIDACDDLEKDAASGAFNPLTGRFGLKGGSLDPEQQRRVRETLGASAAAAHRAAELMSLGSASGITKNIFSQGMPMAAELVLSGNWKKPRPGRHPRDIT